MVIQMTLIDFESSELLLVFPLAECDRKFRKETQQSLCLPLQIIFQKTVLSTLEVTFQLFHLIQHQSVDGSVIFS